MKHLIEKCREFVAERALDKVDKCCRVTGKDEAKKLLEEIDEYLGKNTQSDRNS